MNSSKRTFVGFGFGPIQSGLFLLEAFESGNFDRLVVAEVDASLVEAIRLNKGAYTINIARDVGVQSTEVTGIEMLNPTVAADREKLIAAIAEADEIATALPSVQFYDVGEASVAKLIAAGLTARQQSKSTVIYTAENDNHAAEAMQKALANYATDDQLKQIQSLNTVIGKMSGMIDDFGTMVDLGLTRITPRMERAILVEAFNHILISKIELPDFERGIEVFVEKPDLLPFEEAKLYGHNAVHALIGYLAHRRGLRIMASAAIHSDLLMAGLSAFNQECGPGLIHKWGETGDELFTRDGFRAYSNDLIRRMLNPHLNDRVERVIRDPLRKLAYTDRLYGTMRLARAAGVEPEEMAKGAAAAVLELIEIADTLENPPKSIFKAAKALNRASLKTLLNEIWHGELPDDEVEALTELTFRAMGIL